MIKYIREMYIQLRKIVKRCNIGLLCFMFILSSCDTEKIITREIPVDVVRTEYIHDTLVQTRLVNTYTIGDTIYKTDSILVQKLRIIERHDTIPKIITEYITETIEVEHTPTIWQKLKQYIFMLIVAVFLLVILTLYAKIR